MSARIGHGLLVFAGYRRQTVEDGGHQRVGNGPAAGRVFLRVRRFRRLVDGGVREVEDAQDHPERVGPPEGRYTADSTLPDAQKKSLGFCNKKKRVKKFAYLRGSKTKLRRYGSDWF